MRAAGQIHAILLSAILLLAVNSGLRAQVDTTTATNPQDSTVMAVPTQLPERIFTDSIVKQDKSVIQGDHSPPKAAMLSAVFPGLGQVYNKKYLKLPLVYGALAAATFAITFNHDQYKIYERAFYSQTDKDLSNDQFDGVYDERQLLELRNFYRQNRDLSIILGALAYGLNILDAYVDAHLFYYDISEDLSMRLEPAIMGNQNYLPSTFGLALTIDWR